MQPDKTEKRTKHVSGSHLILLIVTAFVLVFILVQSVLPASVSAEESGWITEKILDPIARRIGMQPLSHHAVRKIAHVFEFAGLSILLVFCFRGSIAKSAGLGFVIAFLDESVQLLSRRGASISDVWIDLIGVALGTAIGFLCLKAVIAVRSRRARITR